MHKLLVLLVLLSASAQAGVVFEQPPPGVAPYDVTLRWTSTPDVVSCNASGAWTGTKPPSGSQLITGIVSDRQFTLTCLTSQLITATLTCSAPTQNTDGSPLTNLAGYRVQKSQVYDEVATAPRIPYPVTSTVFSIPGLSPGLNHFGARAYSSTGAESFLSNIVSKTFAPITVSATVSVSVEARPRAPICQTVS